MTVIAFIANETHVLWYYRTFIMSYILTYWKCAICRELPFPDKLSHPWVHLLKQLHLAAGITHAIITVNLPTDSSICSGKKSRELHLNTQNIYACLFTYIANARSIPYSITKNQLNEALCNLQSEWDTIFAPKISLRRKTDIENNPTWAVNRQKA